MDEIEFNEHCMVCDGSGLDRFEGRCQECAGRGHRTVYKQTEEVTLPATVLAKLFRESILGASEIETFNLKKLYEKIVDGEQ